MDKIWIKGHGRHYSSFEVCLTNWKWKIFSNFVPFSECPNFNAQWLPDDYLMTPKCCQLLLPFKSWLCSKLGATWLKVNPKMLENNFQLKLNNFFSNFLKLFLATYVLCSTSVDLLLYVRRSWKAEFWILHNSCYVCFFQLLITSFKLRKNKVLLVNIFLLDQ